MKALFEVTNSYNGNAYVRAKYPATYWENLTATRLLSSAEPSFCCPVSDEGWGV